MKIKSLLVVTLVAFGIQTMQAASYPSFSLHNKSKNTIYVRVENNDSALDKVANFFKTDADTVLVDGFLDKKNVDISKPTFLHLYDKKGKEYLKATFATGKTIFVNWDGEKLYHQRGRLFGLMGKTDLGYPTKNNITDEEITILKK